MTNAGREYRAQGRESDSREKAYLTSHLGVWLLALVMSSTAHLILVQISRDRFQSVSIPEPSLPLLYGSSTSRNKKGMAGGVARRRQYKVEDGAPLPYTGFC